MGTQSKLKFPLSYSRVSTFETCPLQFEHLYVRNTVKSEGSEATEYGTRVHESLEKYAKSLGDETHLTKESTPFKKYVDKILKMPGEHYYEYQMACTQGLDPCDWFAKDVWMRSIADVLVIDGEKAYCLDWKTGKVRENLTQLQLFACMVMYHFPEVQEVKAAFIWLKYDKVTDATFKREHLEILWERLMRKFDAVQEAVDLGVFIPKPSKLCNWCAAKNLCEYS